MDIIYDYHLSLDEQVAVIFIDLGGNWNYEDKGEKWLLKGEKWFLNL